MEILKTSALLIVTTLAEIISCYLPHLWLKQGRSAWLLVPAAFTLAAFVCLLTLHPSPQVVCTQRIVLSTSMSRLFGYGRSILFDQVWRIGFASVCVSLA